MTGQQKARLIKVGIGICGVAITLCTVLQDIVIFAEQVFVKPVVVHQCIAFSMTLAALLFIVKPAWTLVLGCISAVATAGSLWWGHSPLYTFGMLQYDLTYQIGFLIAAHIGFVLRKQLKRESDLSSRQPESHSTDRGSAIPL